MDPLKDTRQDWLCKDILSGKVLTMMNVLPCRETRISACLNCCISPTWTQNSKCTKWMNAVHVYLCVLVSMCACVFVCACVNVCMCVCVCCV